MNDSLRWVRGSYFLLVPIVAHLLLSPLGFNPTDDGLMLAGARRILEGQIPHRDFISVRPAGSLLLHVPFVAWGGSWTFWLSHAFVWLEWAAIAWIWSGFAPGAAIAWRRFLLALIGHPL